MHRFRSWQLFAICVLAWGTTWHAVTYQVAAAAPEVSVAVRFALAGGFVLLLCRLRRYRLRFAVREHAMLMLQGVFLYGLSYIGIYYAERYIPSGLVAVGYSASPLLAGIGAALLFGVEINRRFVAGGVLGVAGVALIFWPEFGKARVGPAVALGAALTAAAVLLSAVGSLAASRNRSRGMPLWPAMGFGMLYGSAACAAVGWIRGVAFALPSTPAWWLSLAYLALAGTVLTFACFLTLQDRIGPGPSGSIGVMTPLLALLVSVALEGYRPGLFTALGATLAVCGNALMLLQRSPSGRAPTRIRPSPPRADLHPDPQS